MQRLYKRLFFGGGGNNKGWMQKGIRKKERIMIRIKIDKEEDNWKRTMLHSKRSF